MRRYPDESLFEEQVSQMLGIPPERIVTTAGADDGLERVMRSVLEPGREVILPVPTFEMLGRFAGLTTEVPDPGEHRIGVRFAEGGDHSVSRSPEEARNRLTVVVA